MKASSSTRDFKSFALKALVAAVAAYTLSPHHAHGAPAGGVVVDGSGTISQTGADTRIDQATDRLSLEWDSFNVGATERVQFVQPGVDSIALNRLQQKNHWWRTGRIPTGCPYRRR